MKKTEEELTANILNAMAHPNRIRILEKLKQSPLCNCELMPLLNLEQSNLSRHLNILVNAGVIISWRDGTRVNYKIADDKILTILAAATQIATGSSEKQVN
ncbi:MAG: ArsR/SmtB family transcription factor [Methanococcaceae archaeon]